MKAARRSIAFVSGLLLYCFGAGAAMKYASVGLPRQAYIALGGRNSLTVMLGEAIAIALVLFLVATAWAYLTLRPARRRHRPYIAWMMAGVGLAWAGWLIFGAFNFAMVPRAYAAPLQSVLLSSDAPPLYGVLNIVGVVCGVWLGGRWAVRRQLALPSSRRRKRDVPADAAADADDDGAMSTLGPNSVSPPAAP